MQALARALPWLLATAVLLLAVATDVGARPADLVSCSSTAEPIDSAGRPVRLTGTWTGSDAATYSLRQIGDCLWWVGGASRANVFFGRISSSSVSGYWADTTSASLESRGRLTLAIRGSTALYRKTSTGRPPGKIWRRL